jgi:hypothetical protein
MAEETQAHKPGMVSNTLAIAGFVVVLIIVIWGLIHLSTLASPWLSSLFSGSAPAATLHVSAPQSATSSEPFTVSWSYNTSAKGTYSLIYPCNDSLKLETAGAGTAINLVPCGAAFALSGNSLTLIPVLSGTTPQNVALTVVFAGATGGTQAQGSAVVAVRPGTKPAPASVQPAPAPAGPSNLSVQILSASADQSGYATVVFDISNTGAGATGPYTFEAFLPMRSSYTYYSPTQDSLAPGSHIINTLRFTQAAPGAVSIIVDPSNMTSDANRTDNYAGAQLSMPYGYNPQQQYYYGQPVPYVY